MDAPFAGGTDPTPYIAGAYVVGFVLIVGFFIWTLIDRRRLRQLLEAVRKSA